jgi:hypothetical protein
MSSAYFNSYFVLLDQHVNITKILLITNIEREQVTKKNNSFVAK